MPQAQRRHSSAQAPSAHQHLWHHVPLLYPFLAWGYCAFHWAVPCIAQKDMTITPHPCPCTAVLERCVCRSARGKRSVLAVQSIHGTLMLLVLLVAFLIFTN